MLVGTFATCIRRTPIFGAFCPSLEVIYVFGEGTFVCSGNACIESAVNCEKIDIAIRHRGRCDPKNKLSHTCLQEGFDFSLFEGNMVEFKRGIRMGCYRTTVLHHETVRMSTRHCNEFSALMRWAAGTPKEVSYVALSYYNFSFPLHSP